MSVEYLPVASLFSEKVLTYGALRSVLGSHGVVSNICINKRNGTTNNTIVDELLYAQRYAIERTNAWMDS